MKNEVQIQWAEQFDRQWRDKYPHLVTTLGTKEPRPEKVEKELGVFLARLPVPHYGFSLWYFRTEDDSREFIARLPALCQTQ